MDPLNTTNLISNATGVFKESFICFTLPPKVNSPGLAEFYTDENFNLMSYTMPNLEALIVVVFCVTQGLHFAFNKIIALPMLISQILAGLMFNPAILPEGVSQALFSKNGIENLVTVATLGYQLFMFQSGVKMEMDMLKTMGAKVVFIGMLCVLLPLLLGVSLLTVVAHETKFQMKFFAATTYSMCSFPVIVSLLSNLELLNSELGRLGLSTALVSDLVSLLLLIASSILGKGDHQYNEIIDEITMLLFLLLIVVLILRPAMKLLAKKVHDGPYLKEMYVYFIISLFLGSVFLSRFYGLAVFYGPFIIGLAVPSGPPLGSAILDKFEAFTGYILAIFVTSCSMRVDLANTTYDKYTLAIIAILLAVTSFAKFLVCYVGHSLFWESPTSTAVAFSLIMCAKGVVELGLYTFLFDTQYASEQMKGMIDDAFILMVGTVILFGSVVPILVRRLYDPRKTYARHQKRSLMDSNPDSELKIVSCIHVPGDVNALVKLLDASCGGNSNPIAVTVLHHIKLVGQSTPLFISHRKERVIVCDYSYSVNVIRLLNEFEQKNSGSISVNAVTAVSPPKFMHDDICSVAVDKLASFILLPFHIKWWKQDGSIQSEDHTLRDLNNRVLEKAPCSVGILVDRYNHRRPVYKEYASMIKVAMIFLGGNDDREALAFAIRMAEDTRVKLCVARLTAANEDEDYLNSKQDMVALQDLNEKECVTYREEMVDDAGTTASYVKSMVNEYELIIVGRRSNLVDVTPQTAGLEQWCEHPELGLIGDLIVSRNTMGACSLLVLQHVREEKEQE